MTVSWWIPKNGTMKQPKKPWQKSASKFRPVSICTIMEEGRSLWTLAEERGISGEVISLHKSRRNDYYQDYLLTENIEIEGVIQVLEALSRHYSMAIVTTSKRRDFELIHRERPIIRYMDFVLTIEDYSRAKPDPEPYLTALKRFRARPDP